MGRISNIEIQKNNKKRYNIYVDNEYAFSVSEDVLIKESLQKGLDIDDNKLSNIIQEDNFIISANVKNIKKFLESVL